MLNQSVEKQNNHNEIFQMISAQQIFNIGKTRLKQITSFLCGFYAGKFINTSFCYSVQISKIITNIEAKVSNQSISKQTYHKIIILSCSILQNLLSKDLFIQEIQTSQYSKQKIFNKIIQNVTHIFESSRKIIKKDEQFLLLTNQVEFLILNQLQKSKIFNSNQINRQTTCQICQSQIEYIQNREQSDLFRENSESIGFEITNCGHIFHKKCLKQYYISEINSFNSQVRCPKQYCQNQQLPLSQLKQILRQQQNEQSKGNSCYEKQILQKLYDFKFQKYIMTRMYRPDQKMEIQGQIKNEEYFYCITPACNAVYAIPNQQEQYQKEKQSNLVCMKCHKVYCLKCWTLFHSKMTCQENAINSKYTVEDKMFDQFLQQKGKKYKKCPSCNFWVDNWRGCSTIKCRCGIQFCYKCGKTGCPHGKCLNIPQS